MSSDQPEVFESRPPVSTSRRGPESADENDDGHVAADHTLLPDQVRSVVRLIQCRQCSLPLRNPVILPCGRSICRQCLPASETRQHISYPATLDRSQGFDCPFPECGKQHASGDCGVDVVLSKVASHFRKEIERGRNAMKGQEAFTRIFTHDQRAATGVPIMADEEGSSLLLTGGRLLATYTMADAGGLEYEVDVSFAIPTSTASGTEKGQDAADNSDRTIYHMIKETARQEMDCQVCYALFYDPLTTVCGHTFCRSCLRRVLDHSICCPICRTGLSVSPLLHRQSCPSNESLTKIIDTFWREAVLARGETLAAEASNRHRGLDIPIFVCTLAFPTMPTFLHIFEPRYRLMIRRALEGDRTFGMVLPRMAQSAPDAHFYECGTLMRIVDTEYFPDGRSLVETVGISRFKVLRHGTLDGYTVGKVERIDDINIAEEEEIEARETQPQPPTPPVDRSASPDSGRSDDTMSNSAATRTASRDPTAVSTSPTSIPTTTECMIMVEDVVRMPTRDLLQFAVGFVDRMRQRSVPWLAQRILTIYGECPDDPVHFPWWFASILPVKEPEKYRLLETTSVRERLKICCLWVLEWESSSRW